MGPQGNTANSAAISRFFAGVGLSARGARPSTLSSPNDEPSVRSDAHREAYSLSASDNAISHHEQPSARQAHQRPPARTLGQPCLNCFGGPVKYHAREHLNKRATLGFGHHDLLTGGETE
jgi:hypothetical protein